MNLTEFAALIGFACGIVVGGAVCFLALIFLWVC